MSEDSRIVVDVDAIRAMRTRQDIVEHHGGAILSVCRRLVDAHRARHDPYGTFAAAMLESMTRECLSDAFDRPLEVGMAEALLFAEVGDECPVEWPFEVDEGMGERTARWHRDVRDAKALVDGLVSNVRAFRSVLSKAIDAIESRTTVEEIALAAEARAAIAATVGDYAVRAAAGGRQRRARTKATAQVADLFAGL